MQCLSSTNEAFLSQKTDLIAELKMSKDISGIRRMRVEKQKIDGGYDNTDITKQFTATHFVDQVKNSVVNHFPLLDSLLYSLTGMNI